MGTQGGSATTAPGVPTLDDATLLGWLEDDLGPEATDVTSDPLFDERHEGTAWIVTREPLVVSGLSPALRLFRLVGVQAQTQVGDGDKVGAEVRLARVDGPTRAILRAERTALNLLCHLSGIASLTRETQDRVQQANPACRVSATRKTTPGLRALEKLAVQHGGGDPHRYGLFDMILIKDNHRSAGGPLDHLIETTRKAHPRLPLEVEVETREDAETAARAGADWILVDNQTPQELKRIADAARTIKADLLVEASGGILPSNAHEWAPHADRVSLGALTISAPAKDIGLDWEGSPGRP